MKTLIQHETAPAGSVFPEQVSSKDYFGIVMSFGQRGFLTREQFASGNFDVRSTNLFTDGNGWSGDWEKTSDLTEALKCILDKKHSVFVFETFQELAKWLCEVES